jgi:hypothetical protein
MACDDEVIPLQKRIETAADDTDLEEVYNTERHLLYVACTRARDRLDSNGEPIHLIRRLHAGAGSSARDGRRAGLGIPRRSAAVRRWNTDISCQIKSP